MGSTRVKAHTDRSLSKKHRICGVLFLTIDRAQIRFHDRKCCPFLRNVLFIDRDELAQSNGLCLDPSLRHLWGRLIVVASEIQRAILGEIRMIDGLDAPVEERLKADASTFDIENLEEFD